MKLLTHLFAGCLLLLSLVQPVRACSCIDGGPFLTIAQQAAWQPNTLIARVQVVSQREHGIDVRVLDVLHGSEERRTITIWGDPGFMCRTYTTGFKSSDRVILILRRLQPSTYLYQNEQPGDYELGGCGTYALRENQLVTGRISSNAQTMTYPVFLETLARLLDAQAPDKPKVYPVPAATDLTIDIPEQKEPYLFVEVTNLSGKTVQSYQLATGQSHQLPMAPLPGGQYIIRFESEHTQFKRRVLKQ